MRRGRSVIKSPWALNLNAQERSYSQAVTPEARFLFRDLGVNSRAGESSIHPELPSLPPARPILEYVGPGLAGSAGTVGLLVCSPDSAVRASLAIMAILD